MNQKVFLIVQLLFISVMINAQSIVSAKNNLSVQPLTKVNEITGVNKVSNSYDLMDCSLVCYTSYTAGTTMDLVFKLTKDQTRTEMLDKFTILFLTGITPNGSSNSTFPTSTTIGGVENLNLPVTGQSISWGIDNNDFLGGINTTSVGVTFTVNVTVAAGLTGNQYAYFYPSSDSFVPPTGPYIFDIPGGVNIFDGANPVKDLMTEVIGTTNNYNCTFNTNSIQTKITNTGTIVDSIIPVTYEVNGIVRAMDTIYNVLNPGDFVYITFPAPYIYSAQNNLYNIKVWKSLNGDNVLSNDTAIITVPYPLPFNLTNTNYMNGFESDYDIGNVYLDWIGLGYTFYTSLSEFHSGNKALYISYFGNSSSNITYEAFINLPCMDVTAGEIYRISYWRKSSTVSGYVSNGQAAIFELSSQNPTSISSVLKPYSSIVTTTLTGVNGWEQDYVDYYASANKTIYFSIGAKGLVNSTTDHVSVSIDDINISKIGIVSGIESLQTKDIVSVFPNPTDGIVNIIDFEINSSIEVFNIIGDKIYTGILSKGNNSIDLSNFSNGVYFIKLNTGGQIVTNKIVLNK